MSLERKYKWTTNFLNKYYPNFKDWVTLYDEIVHRTLKKDFLFLDAGCGKGEIIAKYKENVRLAVGIDIELEPMKNSPVKENLLVGRLENMPFKDEVFDLILCRWVLEHLEQPQKTFNEFSRILKNNGHLLVLTSNIYNYAMFLNRLMPPRIKKSILAKLGRSESDTFRTYYRCNTVSKIKKVAENNGLELGELVLIGNPFYLFFSRFLFVLGVVYEKLTDISFLKKGKTHIIASFRKP